MYERIILFLLQLPDFSSEKVLMLQSSELTIFYGNGVILVEICCFRNYMDISGSLV